MVQIEASRRLEERRLDGLRTLEERNRPGQFATPAALGLAFARKERVQLIAWERLGLRISGVAGLHQSLLVADAWLADGGPAIWLIPSEFMIPAVAGEKRSGIPPGMCLDFGTTPAPYSIASPVTYDVIVGSARDDRSSNRYKNPCGVRKTWLPNSGDYTNWRKSRLFDSSSGMC